MPYRITLDNYTPSARLADAGVWTQVRYEYAATRAPAAWTVILTEALDPVETNPLLPLTRDLDVVVPDAGYPGWLRVVFLDAAGNQEPTEPVYIGSAIRPSVQEVANLMPDRTYYDGSLVGTFTANTRPTAAQVDALIDLALDAVDPDVLADATAELQRSARSIVALNAAILAETSYFSDQGDVNETRVSVWERLIGRHDDRFSTATTGGAEGGAAAGTMKVGSVIDDVITVVQIAP